LGLTQGHFRVFGEYFISSEEHDLERFQVGYEVIPDTVIWLGRFHQPGSAWDTEHHHGRYLQTAITRPAIENWEDEEGLIPQHITGALVESRLPLRTEAGLQIAVGLGAGPALTSGENRPIDLLGNNPGRHGPAFAGRLAYMPDYAGTSSAGLLFSRDELFASRVAATMRINNVVLTTYGAYADWTLDKWRLIGACYFVDIELDHSTPDGSFISSYAQFERGLPHQLTVFSRLENSARMQRSWYVNALYGQAPNDIDVAIRRQAAGLRWDYASSQALTLEVGHEAALTKSGTEVRLQWSAVVR
jgi:hypothetical protein